MTMETLDGTEWDVIIAGTGFQQSLLALSLSRSGKRILHLDKNDYYGGAEAALSLSEAEAWTERFSGTDHGSTFSHASISRVEDGEGPKLASSRAYALALAPQLVYSRSTLVPALVSSRTHNQLDFQAVGSWFVVEKASDGSQTHSRITRVPSGREDVFQDISLDLKAKRSLMKFLRFVGNYEEQGETWHDARSTPFSEFLDQKFKLPKAVHAPIMALTMSEYDQSNTSTEFALPRIARHLRSIGVFGPGFGAVLPKWGGLAEIAQVACRACAVGGGVYVLNKSVRSFARSASEEKISLELSEGEKLSTTWLAGSSDDLPDSSKQLTQNGPATVTSRSISIVSSSLSSLFPPTSEGGVTPAGAVVVVPSADDNEPPVHILVHTSDAGECPIDQCILYASVALPHDRGFSKLDQAMSALLQGVDAETPPKVLWTMQYQQNGSSSARDQILNVEHVITIPPLSQDLVLEDAALENVKAVWQMITDDDKETFMQFEAREGMEDDEMI